MTTIEIKASIFDILIQEEPLRNQLDQLGQIKQQKMQELRTAYELEAKEKEIEAKIKAEMNKVAEVAE